MFQQSIKLHNSIRIKLSKGKVILLSNIQGLGFCRTRVTSIFKIQLSFVYRLCIVKTDISCTVHIDITPYKYLQQNIIVHP